MLPSTRTRRLTLAALGLALPALALIGINSGANPVHFTDLLPWPADGTAADANRAAVAWITVTELRLPRVIAALIVGAVLAQAGTAMQGLFRNPLAEPGIIGVSAGAALCAALAIAAAEHWRAIQPSLPILIPMAAFAGGIGATLMAARIARLGGRLHSDSLLLAGLAINAIAGAALAFVLTVTNGNSLRSISYWMFGSLARADWPMLMTLSPPLVALLIWLPRWASALDALLLGESEARYLGYDVQSLYWKLLILIALMVALSVALCGPIGFIGLLVPHMLRLVGGPEHRWLLTASALGGAALLSAADLCARLSFEPMEVPVGILTALLGGPFFLVLLVRQQQRQTASP